ncbi:5'-deoxynucleotidase [Paenibacillus daejeonensis]|uniref:5'-deoxynucleotidase n=1 Tax=Paenibacillus daejeonensis TaxID=135193 RepID=UPI0003663764|nr:5'-deoxynucleotidase [Paenibacillus daejeonensis]
MQSHFYAYMYRLKYIERWSLMRNTTRETVAEHSYHVALLVHMLCEIGNQVYGRSLNADRAAAMALFHDATEVFTGDIPTPVKHHNPKMLASFREIEGMAAERLLGMVPEPLHDTYAPLLLPKSAQTDPEGNPAGLPDQVLLRYLKAADLLDAYLKCLSELSSGNREFMVAKGQTEQALAKLEMPEVEWFLTHMAPSFGKTLDELSED